MKREAKQMVNAKRLLQQLWDGESRPSLQWLRMHTGKDIPATRIGRLWFYDLDKVRAALGGKLLS
jgi:hypothetical protein